MPSPSGRTTTTPAWRVAAAEATGAHHIANGMLHEDAWAVQPTTSRTRDEATFAVAVADGHGHARHFRSSVGSKLAVRVASEMGAALAAELSGETDADRVESVLRTRFGPGVVGSWRDEVDKHLRANPVTPEEHSAAGLPAKPTFEDLLYGYGATLLVAVAAGPWLLCLQLGDGDFFLVEADGTVARPLPIDPRLDGLRTTSLCQPDAVQSIRYAVVPVTKRRIGAVMLATDGYGNAQVRNDWEDAFGADLAGLAKEHGIGWIGEQLPAWVRQCASSEGSGDDVTVALLFAAGAAWEPAPRKAPSETYGDTLPDVRAGTTVRTAAAGGPDGPVVVPAAPPIDGSALTVPIIAAAGTPGPGRQVGAEPPTTRITSRPTSRQQPGSRQSAAETVPVSSGRGPAPMTAPPHPAGPPVGAPARSSRRTLGILIAGIVVVVAAVAVMLVVLSSSPSPKPKPSNPAVTGSTTPHRTSTPTPGTTNSSPSGIGKGGPPPPASKAPDRPAPPTTK